VVVEELFLGDLLLQYPDVLISLLHLSHLDLHLQHSVKLAQGMEYLHHLQEDIMRNLDHMVEYRQYGEHYVVLSPVITLPIEISGWIKVACDSL
jgi:hypothetical protein